MNAQNNHDSSQPWHPGSWRAHPVKQVPDYEDKRLLAEVEEQLRRCPPIVLAPEAARLEGHIAAAGRGEAFLLQGGPCAESFDAFSADFIRALYDTLAQMAQIVEKGLGKPVVRTARLAGQYAKPRSSAVEGRNGQELPSYRGDIVNSHRFEAPARRHDPLRMVKGYDQAAATMNYARALASAQNDDRFFVAHEALLLPYEEAFARPVAPGQAQGAYYGASGHFLWIGDRTRQPDGAHVAFLRGLVNPLGIKVGPTTPATDLLALLSTLNPGRKAGRITLIARMGAGRVRDLLPSLVEAVKASSQPVTWVCDPMHANTISAQGGVKTRPFDAIVQEWSGFKAVLDQAGVPAGGIHLEMTGRDVTECTGGPQGLQESDLGLRYESHCDPCLNATQALALASMVASGGKS
ncbi:3-deoxy-7-phosphoheptulonate synthase [Formicincola oecophyllae]|uniref:Phospho-2-dehydro-3-deoxyheptonate aldolase n=1 Tax=Formicincola oecophyllae TaxID=2558361 RepID=A0A4Y6U8S6_9PROT|nr:3-deoxy-7-phosphoheptulonate synthase class II [Formicincola oecophyllae]QDH13859.1 3-deoxy-7-phosphoheptulonate synthase [Formicincola oecophyllae]